jgi:hypothetical protein
LYHLPGQKGLSALPEQGATDEEKKRGYLRRRRDALFTLNRIKASTAALLLDNV